MAQHYLKEKGEPICDSQGQTYGLSDLLQKYPTLFPESQRRLFHELRTEGNLQHEPMYQPTSRASDQLQVAWKLASWIGRQLGWRDIPAEFKSPPKGGYKFDEMRRQRNESLQRVAEAERSCELSGWICADQRTILAPENFVGRQFIFSKIDQFLANPDGGVLLIQGQPGRGKSALIQKFVSERIPDDFIPIVFFFNEQSSQAEPMRWVRHLIASLIDRCKLAQP